MIAAITTKEFQSLYGNQFLFEIDENTMIKDPSRSVTKSASLDGTVCAYDWGCSELYRMITFDNAMLDKTNYEALMRARGVAAVSFHFHYLDTTYSIVLDSVRGVPAGNKYKVNMNMSTIDKNEMETA